VEGHLPDLEEALFSSAWKKREEGEGQSERSIHLPTKKRDDGRIFSSIKGAMRMSG